MLMTEAVEAFLYMTRLSYLSETTDFQVIARKAAMADPAAIDFLTRHYYVKLWTFAKSFLPSPDLADDLTQEVFIKLSRGAFEKYAQTWFDNPGSVYRMLATAVRNAALNYKRDNAKKALTGGGGAVGAGGEDDVTFDPEDTKTGFSIAERQLVAAALQRARATAKLKPDEIKFVDELLQSGFFSGSTPEGFSLVALAKKIWPDKTANAAGVSGNRAKNRFLKALCQDDELKKLLPTGAAREGSSSFFRSNFEPLCSKVEDADPVVVMAVRLGLVEDIADPDRDKAYDEVLRWVRCKM
jgi:DNA-directed RNA polymerase specialized sigma24 family protein